MPKNHLGASASVPIHIPVLEREVLDTLKPSKGESYLDLTAGQGGHAKAVLDRTKSPQSAVLVDRDEQATAYLKARFPGVEILNQDFLSASRDLAASGRQFDLILADLGVSSLHLESADRGFSVKQPAKLDMRMDQKQVLTADDIVNRWPEAKLARLLKEFGEEPKFAQVARNIVRNRPIRNTEALAAIVSQAWPGRSKIHPATRTFQAIRIAVNDELTQLEQSLPLWENLLAPGGRLAAISFHSLEDRLVKNFFAQQSQSEYDSELRLLTKKPIVAGEDETVSNPRARSAKLRAVAKIKTNRKDYA